MTNFMVSNSQQSSVQVIIRIQPPANTSLQIINSQVLQCLGKNYYFDYIFPYEVTQQQIYEKIGIKMIASAKKGFNSCIFAYGQTGSGKTYTMTGNSIQYGLIQRCLKNLLTLLTQYQSYELKLSYYQIYNENIYDLLLPLKKRERQKQLQIKIKQSISLGFYLQNIQEIKIQDEIDIYENIKKGIKNRTTSQTKMNRESSRSHSILTLYITIRQKIYQVDQFSIKCFKMHFVDLAGSEKQRATMTAGDRLKQASSINKSLTTLSMVIEKLSMKSAHVPYRDSALTKILRDSLGGNSKTILIATLSSKQESIAESLSTIHFAAKTKKVKLSAHTNELYQGSSSKLKHRIRQLQQQIKQLKSTEQECVNIKLLKQQYQKLQQTIEQLENLNFIQHQKISQLEEFSCALQTQYQNKIRQLEEYIEELENQLSGLENVRIHLMNTKTPNNNIFSIFNNGSFDEIQHQNNPISNPNSQNFSIFTQVQPQINQNDQNNQQYNLTIIPQQKTDQDITINTNILSQISYEINNKNILQNKGKKQQKSIYTNYTINSKYNKSKESYQKSNKYFENQVVNNFIIQQLKDQILGLSTEVQLYKNKLEQNENDTKKKMIQNKKIYQPIINEWIRQNSGIIKRNLRLRNAVQLDIIIGLTNKMKQYKQQLFIQQQKQKQRNLIIKNTIDQLKKNNQIFKQNIIHKYFNNTLNTHGSELDHTSKPEQQKHHISKSFPKTTAESKLKPPPIYPQTSQNCQQKKQLSFKNIATQIKSNNTTKANINKKIIQEQQILITKYQQQLVVKQIAHQQLIKNIQNFKCSNNQITDQLQRSLQIIKYWEQKYNNICITYKQMQNNLIQVNQQNIRILNQKNNQQIIQLKNLLFKQQYEKLQILKKCQQIQKVSLSNQNTYLHQLKKLQQALHQQQQQNNQLSTKITKFQQNISQLQTTLSSTILQLTTLKQQLSLSKQTITNLQHQQQQKSKSISSLSAEVSRIQQNLSYKISQFNKKMDIKQKQITIIQKQNTKQYMEWLQAIENIKLIGIKYTEIKQQNDRLKQQKQKMAYKHKDLKKFINQQQTQSYKIINKLNEQKTQLQYKSQQLQKKITYLNIQFTNKINEIKYWKSQCEKQKKWADDFKNMQSHFLYQLSIDKSRDKYKISNNKIIYNKNNQHHTFISWELAQSKRQIKQIVVNLSNICGMQITQNSILLQLDKIGQQIQNVKKIYQQNLQLKQKLKVLKEDRKSEFWKKID